MGAAEHVGVEGRGTGVSLSKSRFTVAIVSAGLLSVAMPVVTTASSPAQAGSASARGVLNALTVKSESNSGYSRSYFRHWIDANGDCQNTRQEVLIAESRVRPTFSSGWCTAIKGRWYSMYDGKTYSYASSVDIDHHIPLAEAWGSGARSWSSTDRTRFANDLYVHSLNVMTPSLNQNVKSAKDPAEWMPTVNRCMYAKTWVLVKYRWRLSIDPAEKAVLGSVLSGSCGSGQVTVPARAR